MNKKHLYNIRATKLNFYIRCMRERGIKDYALLAGTELEERDLADNYTTVEVHDYIRVVQNMLKLTCDPALPFFLGKALRPSDLGILGHAFNASDNLVDALSIWQEYSQLFFGNLIENHIEFIGNKINYKLVPTVELSSQLLRFFVEEKISIEVALFFRFNGFRGFYEKVEFSYDKPDYKDLYEELMGVDVQFGCKESAITVVISPEDAIAPLLNRDPETLRVCKNYLDELNSIFETQTTLTARVKHLVERNFPEVLTIEQLSTQFNCSGRTLSRRLHSENTSYASIVTTVRKKLAKFYLSTTDMSADEISSLLGFTETKNFRRALKSWTGMTVNQLRQTFSEPRQY